MTAITITVSFNTEKHARELAWIARHPAGRSAAVREAIAAQVGGRQTTLDDLLCAIDRLSARGVVLAPTADTGNDDEPAAAVMALEELGR